MTIVRRMKIKILIPFFLLALTAWSQTAEDARKVIERFAGKKVPVQLSLTIEKERGCDVFETSVNDGVLTVKGSSGVALCRGFYSYLKSQEAGISSWSGNRMALPRKLADAPTQRVVSPFQHHYYFNVVTYGYTMPYWDWDRWEKEIDWMALHGIDMPLALVGYEAIIARVWKKMGLTDEEINNYFVAPAHLPWMRMGNISGVDAPLNADWHEQQIALQHRILERMRSLGMKPICMGFPGFVPEAFKRIYPDLQLLQTHWGGAFCNWMISPQEELFHTIGCEFIKEWEKEFGKNSYYLVDSFNEMDVPFPAKGTKERYELVASYGEKVYSSIKDANPDAVWTMQGWMFGYQRHIWDYETLAALVSKVPDDKMLLLDLAVDYNRHFWRSQVNWEYYKGFYNKQWVYSVIPNMGGKTGMTGVLDFYANGHLDALSSPLKGNLVAHGMAPEGTENNEVIYELLADAGWSSSRIDLPRWLENYSKNRYGGYSVQINDYWQGLLKSVYGTFTDHPRYNWQLRPGMATNGSIHLTKDFFQAIEQFVQAEGKWTENALYKADVAALTALYLGGKAEWLTKAINWQYEIGDTVRAAAMEKDFAHILTGMDNLLSTHPTLSLERWVNFAHKHAVTPEQKKQYERNAKRIVTIWGPPVDDYSARVWAGLLRDYYLPRWQNYFDSRKSGQPFDFAKWEAEWVNTSGLSKASPAKNVLKEARKLIAYASYITPELFPQSRPDELGKWTLQSGETQKFVYTLSAETLSKIKGIRLSKQNGMVSVQSLTVVADGVEIAGVHKSKALTRTQKSQTFPVAIAEDVRANNGAVLTVEVKNTSSETLSGEVSLIL